MIYYKMNVLQELKKAGYNQTILRQRKLLSQGTITALRNNEIIGIKSLNNICLLLRCQPSDIIGCKATDEEKIKFF